MNLELRSTQFRHEREKSWRELETLLDRLEEMGPDGLTHDELAELPMLYRAVVGSLSVANAISLDRNLQQYLTALSQRAHLAVYSGRRRPGAGLLHFFASRFPAIVRRFRVAVLVAMATLLLGVAVGYVLTQREPDRYYSFVSGDMQGGRHPAASTHSLRQALYTPAHERRALDVFAAFLFDHNARIGILCLALGFAAGVPVLALLFTNGLSLGAMAALYASRGLAGEFWAWVLPHGVTELLAVVLCGAAGLVFGAAMVAPGEASRLERLSEWGREAGLMVVGTVALFFVAAMIEGFFRALVHAVPVRTAVAVGTALFWTIYFVGVGRGRRRARA